MKRDMSFTSQILLEMKSNELWTSPWQQLRLINPYPAQIFMRPDFMNPRLNLHSTRQAEFDNRRSLVWIWCDNYSVPSVSSLRWAPVFCPGSSVHGPRLLPDAIPLRSRGRDGAKTRRRKSHLEIDQLSSTFHLQLRDRKKYKGAKENIILGHNSPLFTIGPWRGFSKPLTCFHQKLFREEKNTPKFPLKNK